MAQRELQVGDRVKCISEKFEDWRKAKEEGLQGEIIESSASGLGWRVQWENGKRSSMLQDHDLTLIPTPAPLSITLPGDPPASISINGVTYVAQAEAAAEEEKPEVKAGQVWRNRADELVLVGMEIDDKQIRPIALRPMARGTICGSDSRNQTWLNEKEMTFIAHSLRDALTSGKLKPEDL